jgi:SAM-dependent methyltransferase
VQVRSKACAHKISSVGGVQAGWEEWRWDETLFGGAANYYVDGRVPYAEGLSDFMESALGLDGRGRLLDVGCGPGVIALRLAHLFETVVGLDSDADMLAVGARQAEEFAVGNISWAHMRAEELPGTLGKFRIAAFAASFHWMDRPKVANAVAGMLEMGGSAVQIDAPSYRVDSLPSASAGSLPHPLPPEDDINALRSHYLGPGIRAGRGIRNSSPNGEDQVFTDAGFAPMRQVLVPDGRVIDRSIDQLVAQRFSSSSTAPHLFGSRLEEFETDLRQLLMAASPSGLFSVRLPDNVISIWEHARKSPTAT